MNGKKIAILGSGNLGTAIAEGLVSSEFTKGENITVTRRKIHLIEHLKDKGINVTNDNIDAINSSEIIILAVKPYQVLNLISSISSVLIQKKHIIISAVTGVSINEINKIIPNIPVYRAMPNTAIALRESMTCISSGNGHDANLEIVKDIFDHLGKTVVINEELMGAATVIGACGVAFALRFMRAMSQGGIEIGFGSELSQYITAQTIKGATQLILESNNHPEREIDKVTTPQGITISGLNEMEHQGFSSSVIKGLLQSYKKLEAMEEKKSKNKN